MRKSLITIFFALCLQGINGQKANYDSLKNLLASSKDDSTRFVCLGKLFFAYLWSYPDSSLTYVQQAFLLAKKIKSESLLCNVYRDYGWFYILIGDYPQALNSLHECLRLAETSGNFLAIARAYDLLVVIYVDEGDYQRAFSYEKMAKSVIETRWKPSFGKMENELVPILFGMAGIYQRLNKLDSALKYVQIVDSLYKKINGKK
jgi:tetratricopeptide (TPR) repeat protein